MPFIDQRFFLAAKDYYPTSISSWGIYCYAYPMLAIALDLGDQQAVFDNVIGSHIRPVASDDRTFTNKLTAHNELKLVKQQCLREIQERCPSILEDQTVRDVLEPTHELSSTLQRLKKLTKLPRTLCEKLRTNGGP